LVGCFRLFCVFVEIVLATSLLDEIVENKGDAQVWVGIQTYAVNLEDKSPIPLSSEEILSECELIKGAGAEGVVLFRHGLGTLPDLKEFW
jgi:hypothetical protein